MGLIVVDAGVVIGFLDSNDAHHDSARAALGDAIVGRHRLSIPVSALAEVLVGPSRSGDDAVAVVRELLDRVPIEIVDLDDRIATVAARLRARHRSLKLPDALVIATAAVVDADLLITTDRGWPPRHRLGLRAEIVELRV
ncbi:MAG: PIN domain-containing protein [Acidimicrobiia bacterium]|nr:PIN domain-containing protein [Acidimicrobiia bacterium]